MTEVRASLPPVVLDAIDRFIAKSDVPPAIRLTREDALVVIARDWLMGQGYLPIPQAPGELVDTNPSATPALHVTDDTDTVFGELGSADKSLPS
jgi:hypothetical protein